MVDPRLAGLLSPSSRFDAGLRALAELSSQLVARGAPRTTPTPPPMNLGRVMQAYDQSIQNDLQRGLALRQFQRSEEDYARKQQERENLLKMIEPQTVQTMDEDMAPMTVQQPSALMQSIPAAMRPIFRGLVRSGQAPEALGSYFAAMMKPPGRFQNVVIDGKPTVATNAQIRQAQASGLTVEPYSAPSTSINLNQNSMVGKPPPGYAFVQDPNSPGGVVAVAIPGSPAAKEQAAAAEAAQGQRQEQVQAADVVIDNIGTALTQIGPTTTGLVGDLLKGVGGTGAKDLQASLSTVKANIGFDRLQRMRKNSKTGAALGSVSEGEREALEATFGNIQQSQTGQQLRRNLIRLNNQYLDTIHGVGKGPPRLTITAESDSFLPQGIPAGSVAIGRNANGNVVYQTLTGKRLVAD